MNTIEFYNRYYPLATEYSTFNATKKDMPDKEVRVKELELQQQTTELFADYMGSNLNLLA